MFKNEVSIVYLLFVFFFFTDTVYSYIRQTVRYRDNAYVGLELQQ